MTKRSVQMRVRVFSLAAALGCAAVPGTAKAGFFENLFGGGMVAPQQVPVYGQGPVYRNDVYPDDGFTSPPRDIHRFRKQAVQGEKPVLQKATDIWHDKTLRDGDAFMMKDGLHVYVGSDGARPVSGDLPRLDNVDMPKRERSLLVSMDTTRNDPLKSGAAPDTIASGRSAAVASAVVSGYRITDARGKSVRYVGP